MKDRIKNLFAFSRKEQRGIIILLALLLCMLAAHYFLPILIPVKEFDIGPYRQQIEEFKAALAAADSAAQYQNNINQSSYPRKKTTVPADFLAEPFEFDPNTLDEESWQKTGLNDHTIRSILRYRQKGGEFRVKEDLKKIYSMTDSAYLTLEPYIQIKRTHKAPEAKDTEKRSEITGSGAIKTDHIIQTIELNTADSATLTELPGIGPYYASRIIKYRDALGGLYTADQLLEISGIDSTRFSRFKDRVIVDREKIARMDLNSVSFKEMLRHPYFEYYLVKAIFNYRDQVRRYDSVGQLKELELIYEELFEKIGPYLVVMFE